MKLYKVEVMRLYKVQIKQGTGPLLVFLHGFLGTSEDWRDVASRLPFSSIGFDLPGHGASPFINPIAKQVATNGASEAKQNRSEAFRPSESIAVAARRARRIDLAKPQPAICHLFSDRVNPPDFCGAFFEATRDFPPFYLIGYSMGGRLALQFAAKHPERLLGIIAMSSHLGLKTKQEREARLEKDHATAREILDLSIDAFLAKWYDQPLFKTLVSTMDIRSMRQNQNKQNISDALKAFSLGHQQDLSHIPAKYFVGEFDAAYRSHYANYTKVNPILIPNAGHAGHLENPIAVAGAIYDSIH